MDVYRSRDSLQRVTRKDARGSVVAIGAFDGLHLGHEEIIRRVRQRATALQAVSLLFAFDPTPKEYFKPDNPPARLTRFRERAERLRMLDIDRFFCPRFNESFRQMKHAEFLQGLIQWTHPKAVVVGGDFRFGHQREGGIDDLDAASHEHGFELIRVPPVLIDGMVVSSSAIRQALQEADFDRAAKLLGRRYMMSGRVAQGRHLGRQIGFPTANIKTGRLVSPVSGVHAVHVHGLQSAPLPGVANIGFRPTVQGGALQVLEVHLFDFGADIYGRMLHVEFIGRIRDEMRFQNVTELAAQINRDCATARAILGL